LPVAAGAQEWRQFRGPNGDGVVKEAKLPGQWGEDQEIAWKTPIPGRGWSQPVVAGDKIFVTTAVADDEEKPRRGEFRGIVPDAADTRALVYRCQVLCLDASTGKVLWEQTAHEGKPKTRKHRSNTYASETPATDGERLIAYFGMTGIYCYDLSGKPLWSKNLGTYPMQAGWGTGSSPVLFGDAVFVQCDNDKSSFLVALDKRTGDELWRVARDEQANWSTPFLWKNKQRTELVTAGGTRTRSYDPANGGLLWEMTGSGRTSMTPVGDDELLFVDSFKRFEGSPGRLAAIRAGATGDVSLREDETANASVAWSTILNFPRNASPLLYADCLYMLEQMQGIVRCFNARTGKLHYQARLPEATGFTASPWGCDGKIFCLDEAGLTVAFEAGPQLKVLASNRLNDDMFWASSAVAGDRLLLRGMQHLYCIGR
jgi:outer membrane protein assembly factor BamB